MAPLCEPTDSPLAKCNTSLMSFASRNCATILKAEYSGTLCIKSKISCSLAVRRSRSSYLRFRAACGGLSVSRAQSQISSRDVHWEMRGRTPSHRVNRRVNSYCKNLCKEDRSGYCDYPPLLCAYGTCRTQETLACPSDEAVATVQRLWNDLPCGQDFGKLSGGRQGMNYRVCGSGHPLFGGNNGQVLLDCSAPLLRMVGCIG